MAWRLRWVSRLGLLLLALAAAPATAAGKLPVASTPTYSGVTSLSGDLLYATVQQERGTTVLRVETDSGKLDRSRYMKRPVGVPVVAADGSASGLSADGQTLVVLRSHTSPRPETTTFSVLEPGSLGEREEVTLNGYFGFDAISPDGRLLYLIRYTDPRDPAAYEVRVYDLEQRKLLPEPIVDPDEPDEPMTGWSLTRAMSPDGRWAYTLYDSLHRHHRPFIHALDTEGATAQCIDLDALSDDDRRLWRMRLEPSSDGTTLAVTDHEETVLTVDLATLEVTEGATAADSPSGSGGAPYAGIAAGAVALGALVLIGRRVRRNGS
jgi:hypothetical protein